MTENHYLELSQKVWDEAEQQHCRSSRIPGPISADQAKAQFATITRCVLFAMLGHFCNYVREREKLPAMRQHYIHPSLGKWIDGKLGDLDEFMGHPVSRPYRLIVNGFLAELRGVENYFLAPPCHACGRSLPESDMVAHRCCNTRFCYTCSCRMRTRITGNLYQLKCEACATVRVLKV
jgi:hypothetical protein